MFNTQRGAHSFTHKHSGKVAIKSVAMQRGDPPTWNSLEAITAKAPHSHVHFGADSDSMRSVRPVWTT